MEAEPSPQSGRTKASDPNGANMGGRNPPLHLLRPTKHPLPPTGQDHGLPPRRRLPPDPAGSMSIFTMSAILATTIFYDRVFVPIACRFTGLDCGITVLHRMGVGFTISVLHTLVAGFVEVKRKQAAADHGLAHTPSSTIPISVFWLVPQYSLHGITEAFMSIGQLQFFYDQSPESMKSTANALLWTPISVGNYVSTLLVTLVHKLSARPDDSNWLPDNNLNVGKLEYFY